VTEQYHQQVCDQLARVRGERDQARRDLKSAEDELAVLRGRAAQLPRQVTELRLPDGGNPRFEVVLRAITDALHHNSSYVLLRDRERAAAAVLAVLELPCGQPPPAIMAKVFPNSPRMGPCVEVGPHDVHRDERGATWRPLSHEEQAEYAEIDALNHDDRWGDKPSYRCWITRHRECERDGADSGCTCRCHEESEVAVASGEPTDAA
jgi:hypothetical protein